MAEMPPQHLYVFLDEAGDFNFSLTGTRFFTLTTITNIRPFSRDAPLMSLKYDLIEVGLDIEYFVLRTMMAICLDGGSGEIQDTILEIGERAEIPDSVWKIPRLCLVNLQFRRQRLRNFKKTRRCLPNSSRCYPSHIVVNY